MNMPEPLHRALGLTDDEAESIERILGREPNELELAMYSVMWSEHCSYKSSRCHLRRLPTSGEKVIVGPGENAGVVDVGDGIAAALRIESHNHPSAVEPYQGAATGVGGILRDVFTMGARPVAVMDPLRFGDICRSRTRWIADGVVRGISGYGNAVGVPTIGGECVFDPAYDENPLVNVLCLGLMPRERLVLGRAQGVGNLAVLIGAATGRDGIGGVSVLASAGFDDQAQDKRPSVQIGDPFEEKRLIEACLELFERGVVVGVQDLGGAGLTCATSETASRGGVGMDVDVTAVHVREPDMEPFEIMTSESQERMLVIVTPERLGEVFEVCDKWEITASVVGRVTAPDADGVGRLRVMRGFEGEVLADIPASSLHDGAPEYVREASPPSNLGERRSRDPGLYLGLDEGVTDDLLSMMEDLSWVWEQYDHQLFCDTVLGPGADAAVLRLRHPVSGEETGRGLALTTDGNHRWCEIDPRVGTEWVVAEAVSNLACVGATPLALVNCLNFGNPEHPEVMWQFSEAVDGLAEASAAFGIPVVGGNVSFYNESRGRDIPPTPVVGLLGVIEPLVRRPPEPRLAEGDVVVMLGAGRPVLAGSKWAWRRGERTGMLPALDFERIKTTVDTVVRLVRGGVVNGVHDISDGGALVCLAEMAVRGGVGCSVARLHDAADLFGELPGRFVLSVQADRVAHVEKVCEASGVGVVRLGQAGGDELRVKDVLDIPLRRLVEAARSMPRARLDGLADH
ncbi:MAG: phosphoribosylformylglycinamidine synthase subunit PurL [Acidimicrobiales bacterium]|nr:MAG: phosphoribosylformylglycinamidine synthase subunit PurL [Acidimicrobiales bacterium]